MKNMTQWQCNTKEEAEQQKYNTWKTQHNDNVTLKSVVFLLFCFFFSVTLSLCRVFHVLYFCCFASSLVLHCHCVMFFMCCISVVLLLMKNMTQWQCNTKEEAKQQKYSTWKTWHNDNVTLKKKQNNRNTTFSCVVFLLFCFFFSVTLSLCHVFHVLYFCCSAPSLVLHCHCVVF
jgi:uncharacterized membrane protein